MNSTPSMAGSAAAARPLVVDLVEFAHHRRDRQIALPREAAVEWAQKQQIHLDPGSIGGLNEDDPLRRDLPDVVDRQPPGQQCGCAPAPATLEVTNGCRATISRPSEPASPRTSSGRPPK
jgi:hypothetical protein